MQSSWIFFFTVTVFMNAEIKAVFDIGSGAVKMQIARIDEETQKIESLFCLAIPCIFSGNEIGEENLYHLEKILEQLKEEANRYQPNDFLGFATERFRKAKNGEESLAILSKRTGIKIGMIDSYEEGVLGFLTAVNENGLDPKNVVVWDIGSGSFQITCQSNDGYIVYQSPYGKGPALSLIESHEEIFLRDSLKVIPDSIRIKILANGGVVVGIGAHPKGFALDKKLYTYNQISDAFEGNEKIDLNLSALFIVKEVMEALEIRYVQYFYSYAGNTTGFLEIKKK